VDRLVDHCHIVGIKGESYRQKQAAAGVSSDQKDPPTKLTRAPHGHHDQRPHHPNSTEPRRRHENWPTGLVMESGTATRLTHRDSHGHDHNPNMVLTHQEALKEPRLPVNLIDATFKPD